MKKWLSLFVITYCLSFFSNASIIYNIDVNTNKLLSVNNISVDGDLYNVTFSTKSFYALFDSALGLDATTSLQSRLFSQSLIEQVLLNTPLGDFSSEPTLFNGCSNIYSCAILTPYILDYRGANPQWVVDGYVATITTTASPYLGFNIRNPNFGAYNNWVYADWELVKVSTPSSTIHIILSAFFLTFLSIKTRRNKD